MRANYISYFRGNLGQSKLEFQSEVAAGASNTAVDVKKASCSKIRREKPKVFVKESELFLQYSLDL